MHSSVITIRFHIYNLTHDFRWSEDDILLRQRGTTCVQLDSLSHFPLQL